MTTTQTIRRQPPLRNSNVPAQMQYWELETQQANPLVTVDTSDGPETITPPPAGLIGTTGQTNQNQEITYIKTSADANVATIIDVEGGPYFLIGQFNTVKIKSDGTSWWPLQ